MRKDVTDILFLRSPRLNQLQILNQLAADPGLTQAELARRCALSVAMINNYMKEFRRAGWLRYHRKSPKNISYHLTRAGSEQMRALEDELLRDMVDRFARTKERILDRILGQAPGGIRRAVIYGGGHLAELVFHALESAGVSVVGVCDELEERIGTDWCGRRVLDSSQIRYLQPDAVVIADLARTDRICSLLSPMLRDGIPLIRLNSPAHEERELPETGSATGDPGACPELRYQMSPGPVMNR